MAGPAASRRPTLILTTPLSANHHLVQTPDELQGMVTAMQGARERGVDFETDGLRWFQGDRPFSAAVGFLDSAGTPHCSPLIFRV